MSAGTNKHSLNIKDNTMSYLAFFMMVLMLPPGLHHFLNGGGMNWFLGLGIYFFVYLTYQFVEKKKPS